MSPPPVRDATGYALLPVDSDGVVRRFDERIEIGGSTVPTLAGQIAGRLGREVGHGLIDYAAGKAFDYVPLHSVLEWHDAGDTRKLDDAFGGKVVLLGGVFRFEDRLAAPVNLLAWDAQAVNAPGVVLHAQALRNLLNDGLIAPVPGWIVPALCLLMAIGWFVASDFAFAAGAVLAGGIAVLAASTWLLARGAYLPPMAVLLALTLRSVHESLRSESAIARAPAAAASIRRVCQPTHHAGHPAQRSASRPWRRALPAVRPLRRYPRLYRTERENRAGGRRSGLLNRYFSEVTACIHGAGGTLDKFIGDGVMAFFGAPQRLDNPCVPAFCAARDMLERVSRLNAALAREGESPIAIGIGLHVGDAVVGNMGSEARYNYTAIGDTVNVASRLEGLTKDVDYPLVCSASVFASLDDRAGFVKLGARPIKGHQPVEVYGWRPDDAASPDSGAKTT